jgi:hypothetical protein
LNVFWCSNCMYNVARVKEMNGMGCDLV